MNLSYRDEMPPTPQRNKTPLFQMTPKTLLFIGIGIAVVIIGFLLLFFSSRETLAPQLQRLSARLNTTQQIIDDSQRSVRSGDLRKISSDASILTAGSIAQLREPLANAGMGTISADVLANEADTATLEALEAAKTGGRFDQVYARALDQKIDTLIALMREIYDNTRSESLREALDASYRDYAALSEQLKALNL